MFYHLPVHGTMLYWRGHSGLGLKYRTIMLRVAGSLPGADMVQCYIGRGHSGLGLKYRTIMLRVAGSLPGADMVQCYIGRGHSGLGLKYRTIMLRVAGSLPGADDWKTLLVHPPLNGNIS